MKSQSLKKLIFPAAVVATLVGGYYSAQHFATQNVFAEDSVQTKETQERNDVLVQNMTHQWSQMNIMNQVFEEINVALDKKEKLSQEKLDGYSFYMLSYWESDLTFTSTGTSDLTTPDIGLKKLLELYAIAEIEPSFELSEDLSVVTTRRAIAKPETFDKVQEEVKEEVKDVVENLDETNRTEEIKIDTEIDTELVTE